MTTIQYAITYCVLIPLLLLVISYYLPDHQHKLIDYKEYEKSISIHPIFALFTMIRKIKLRKIKKL